MIAPISSLSKSNASESFLRRKYFPHYALLDAGYDALILYFEGGTGIYGVSSFGVSYFLGQSCFPV